MYEVDWKLIDKYLQAQCDGVSIASMLGINPKSLYRKCKEDHGITFQRYSQLKKSEGKELIRSAQFKQGMSGDTKMLIWLGRQYLDQSGMNELQKEQYRINNKLARIELKNKEDAGIVGLDEAMIDKIVKALESVSGKVFKNEEEPDWLKDDEDK